MGRTERYTISGTGKLVSRPKKCLSRPAFYFLVPGFFPWGKRLRREVDHSPPSTAAIKNQWS